jgi:hypothetical protein
VGLSLLFDICRGEGLLDLVPLLSSVCQGDDFSKSRHNGWGDESKGSFGCQYLFEKSQIERTHTLLLLLPKLVDVSLGKLVLEVDTNCE